VIAVLVGLATVIGIVAEREDHRPRIIRQQSPRERGGRRGAGILPRRTTHIPDGEDYLF
jgi:hypothetical protein